MQKWMQIQILKQLQIQIQMPDQTGAIDMMKYVQTRVAALYLKVDDRDRDH